MKIGPPLYLWGQAVTLWWYELAPVSVAVVAGVADHRRRHRADLDRVGWVDWPTVQALALIAAAMLAAVAASI